MTRSYFFTNDKGDKTIKCQLKSLQDGIGDFCSYKGSVWTFVFNGIGNFFGNVSYMNYTNSVEELLVCMNASGEWTKEVSMFDMAEVSNKFYKKYADMRARENY